MKIIAFLLFALAFSHAQKSTLVNITAISPSQPMIQSGSIPIVIKGTGFTSNMTLSFTSSNGHQDVPTVFVDNQTLTASTPDNLLLATNIQLDLDSNNIAYNWLPTDGTITISPGDIVLSAGKTAQFSATSTLSNDTIVWSVDTQPPINLYTITPDGLLKAPKVPTHWPYVRGYITATSTIDPSKSAMVTVTTY